MPEPAQPPKALIQALRKILYPLAKVMLAKGVSYPMLADLLKSVFVQVAEREFPLAEKAQTDSRISLLTGVHRKDVRRLRHFAEEADVPANVPIGAQLVAAWLTAAGYTDAEGRPRALPRLASSGEPVSFEALVASVSRDIRSRVVLDEWLRLGVVHLEENDRVALNTAAFIPQRGFEEKLFYYGHNVGDHLAAAGHNVLEAGPPFLERSVHYDALTEGSVAELARIAEKAGMGAALAVNRRASDMEKRDAAEPGPRHRITFGIYFYSAVKESAPDGENK